MHGSAGRGTIVKPTVMDEEGNLIQTPPVRCHVVTSGIHADAPARAELLNCMGIGSYLGCFYCWFSQILVNAKLRFMGYSSPVQICRGFLNGQHKQMVCFSFGI